MHLEELEPRCCPTTFTPGGGIPSPTVENVYVGNVQNEDAFTNVLVSQYAPLLSCYGVGPGSYQASVHLPDPGSALTDAWVQGQVAAAIQNGSLPHPGPNTLIMVYLPRNVADSWAQNDLAYHYFLPVNGTTVPYGVVYTQSSETVPASHEFAEMAARQEICDPYNGLPFQLGGFAVSEFAIPDGAEYVPPPTTNPLLVQWELLLEEYWAYVLYEQYYSQE